jgi:hypothetical protein
MSETVIPESAVVAACTSNTPLILQRLPFDRDRLKRWPASCEVRLDIASPLRHQRQSMTTPDTPHQINEVLISLAINQRPHRSLTVV